MVDGSHECGSQRSCVLVDQWSQLQPFAYRRQYGSAELTVTLQHEIDRLGRDSLRGANKVTFVFTMFVIEHDDHLAARNRSNCILNRTK
jgi:hypothetical protein